ncbi:MAG: T9SS type A sorting domain-containing protein, partial [Candidatus Cloacimonadaceae bacterium]
SFLYEGQSFWGKTTLETEFFREGEDWFPEDRVIWEYNDLLNPVHRRDEYYLWGQWNIDYKNDFTYDANNQIDTIIGQEYDGDEYHLDEKIEFNWEQVAANNDLVAPLPKLDFKVHPNPFADMLSVETDSGKNAPLKLEVYNLRGQKLYQTTTNSKIVDWNGVDLKGKTLPAGVYFVRLSQDGVSGTKRVLKLK